MSIVAVIAPHPDDETLGCGGTILKHLNAGDEVHWIIVTQISEEVGFSKDRIRTRRNEVKQVADAYNMTSYSWLEHVATTLSPNTLSDLIGDLSGVINRLKPDQLYVPYPGDIHSDHEVVFNAIAACSKSFRYPFIKKICCYETLSETEFSVNPMNPVFKPNLFVDISDYLERKIDIMHLYKGEILPVPFPRSEENMRALARYRGAVAGCSMAEAFMILKEVI
ncbi:PIG-L family deacetylase [Pseudoalteromonas sp. MMG013]|uniref:PIG-L deacetylase family protein n=1 Tax=Pseudoalteromonas sp. MMG013 TaxID=2822687 RepID=UPI001B3678BF|nr:PIG-L deacetylase family protein [Pseudoalteromonas sp. MMG013]MBQ4861999.1 PIG-L family deacetylase [Pseudoalteromonas sp. MMG013]